MGVGRERENLSLYISLEREKERSRENTLRARVHAHARGARQEAGHETRAGRKTRGTRHETRVTRGGKVIKKSTENAHKMHGGQLLKNY